MLCARQDCVQVTWVIMTARNETASNADHGRLIE